MWKRILKGVGIVVGLLVLAIVAFVASKLLPYKFKSLRPSQPAQAACTLPDGRSIHVDYSVPHRKGRKIFGGMVPFGTEWRTGANEATTFVTDTDLVVGSASVPAGSYTIFTLPNRDNWKLIVSKKTDEWGIPYPGEQYDFVRTDMKVSQLPALVEDLLIAFDRDSSGCTMRIDWETTRASVEISERK
jgi:hypothetical protein